LDDTSQFLSIFYLRKAGQFRFCYNPDAMLIQLNGQQKNFSEGATILAVLEALKLSPDKVAVELNRRLVKTAQYSNALTDGDQVEIVTFVGGG